MATRMKVANRPQVWRRALALGFLFGVPAAMIYLQASSDGLAPARPGVEGANLNLLSKPQLLPDLELEDDKGDSLRLSDFRGKIILLNVWATWCAPCRKEMPTLDRLQAAIGESDFQVVPLSVDTGGLEKVRTFFAASDIEHLGIYLDRGSVEVAGSGIMGMPVSVSKQSLGVIGVPTTILINRKGEEIGRLIGPAQWDSPEMAAFIRERLSIRDE